jgi:hypothetical protein
MYGLPPRTWWLLQTDKQQVFGYFIGGSDDAAKYMANIAAQAVEQCPITQLVLSGFRRVPPPPDVLIRLTGLQSRCAGHA